MQDKDIYRYQRIDQVDDELYAFCFNQKTYYQLEKVKVTKDYLQEDMQIPQGYDVNLHYCIKIYFHDKMIGYIDYQKGYRFSMQHDDSYAWIGLFLIDEHYHGQKHGTKIMNDIFSYQFQGVKHIQLACLNHNDKGMAFWKSLGFYRIGDSYHKDMPVTILQYDL